MEALANGEEEGVAVRLAVMVHGVYEVSSSRDSVCFAGSAELLGFWQIDFVSIKSCL
jgi:hypothetical protein